MEKEEYIKPLINVLCVADLLDNTAPNIPVSPHAGAGTGFAKPYDFEEDEEDVEANKWGTTLPTNVPDAWKSVGE